MSITTLVIFRGFSDTAQTAFENNLADVCRKKLGFNILLLPHIYHLSDQSPVWTTLRETTQSTAFVSWLHCRAATALLSRRELEVSPSVVFSMTDLSADDSVNTIADALNISVNEPASPGAVREITDEVSERWYPVIDPTRCTSCGNCLQFCIFNVYEYDDAHRVLAANPDNCKPGCPACSRVCPQSAIMFPLYTKDPAISGAPGMFVTQDLASPRAKITMTNVPSSPDATPAVNQDALDDIDLLINDLENLTRRRS